MALVAGAEAGEGARERSGLPYLSGVVEIGLLVVLLTGNIGGPRVERESRLDGLG